MRRNFRVAAFYGTVSILLILSACITLTPNPSEAEILAAHCEACDQATLAVILTQEKNYADNQAAAAAEIVRANAQSTLNSANAVLSAAQTQDQNNANVLAAQIAATAEIVRANAQATLDSASSTQNAALTQDVIHQTQMADLATTGAQALVNQQNKDELAANTIAMQQAQAAATSQWYTDQERQRNVQRQGPITFLWVWCFPVFIVLLAGLVLWGVWQRLKIQQDNQRILEIPPADKLPASTAEVIHYPRDDSLPYLESDIVGNRYLLTKPDDEVRAWLDEVKNKLRSSDTNKKDEDDYTDN
ncbi:MAG TPA: hypothetical protein VFQ23_01310 [Anaerolineales bacterium]|nr:hypothetical protein [Anaerolineales bacterium]